MMHDLGSYFYPGLVGAALFTAALWRLESLLFWRGWPVTYLNLGLPLAYFAGAAGFKQYGYAGALLGLVGLIVAWYAERLMRGPDERSPVEVELKLGCALVASLSAATFYNLALSWNGADSVASLLLWSTLAVVFAVDLYMFACLLLFEVYRGVAFVFATVPRLLLKALGLVINLLYQGMACLTDSLAAAVGSRRQ